MVVELGRADRTVYRLSKDNNGNRQKRNYRHYRRMTTRSCHMELIMSQGSADATAAHTVTNGEQSSEAAG